MAIWLVKHQADPPRYEILREGEYATGVDMPTTGEDIMAYWRAAQRIKANILRRFEDPEPKFAANANEPEALAFAEMLNA